MSFAKTLWASLARSYSLPDRTAPMDETKTGWPEQSLEKQCTAHQQPGAPYVQHDPHDLQQAPQQLQMEHSRGQVIPPLSYPQSTDQGRVRVMQFPKRHEGDQRYNDTYGFRYVVDYTAGLQAQHGFVQPSVNLPPSWPPSNCVSLNPTEYSGQTPSIHGAHGGDAYNCWQAQQLQQQQEQTQYGWQDQATGQQPRFNYVEQMIAHQVIPAHNSYLSPLGVPFDLPSSNPREQPVHIPTGPCNEYRPVYTGPKSGSHKAFYGAYEPLEEDPGPEAQQSYETHTTTIDPACTYLPYDSDETEVDQKPETDLEYLPVDQQGDSADGMLVLVQNGHVGLSRLSANAEGDPWLADNQRRLKEQVDCHHHKLQAVHGQSVHDNLTAVHAPPVDPLEGSARPRPTTELSEVYTMRWIAYGSSQ
ncbi:hypothetical protein EJ07DRAFT_172749 [Lizonia empirigonia]|nr:hypothetical protein EJ07DRAFT_172749 [Lizonia empirigonia]